MSTTLPRVEEPGDAELISAVRGGDADAYGELFARHVGAARRLARQLVHGGDADDLVSEAFAKVLVVLQRGGGPDLAFRAYLLTAIRRLHVDRIRAGARLHTTDDLTPFDPGVPFRDTAVEGFEAAAAAKAFSSLPERWQTVLWHTEVEGQKPAEVAVLLGMSANSVSALAYRAREGLRQAFLEMHLQDSDDESCARTHRHLGPYVRHGISRRDAAKVEDHLTGCRTCTAIYLELTEVNANLSGVLAPALLGSALAAAYVGPAGSAVAKGSILVLVDRVRDLVAAHVPASAAAGVAASVVLGGGVFLSVDREPPTTSADLPTAGSFAGDRARDGDTTGRDAATRGGVTPDRPDRLARASPASPGTGTPVAPDSTPAPPGAPPDGPPSPSTSLPPGGTGATAGSTGGPPPDAPPAADLAVRASATSEAPGVFRVSVVVTGLVPGATARLLVSGSGLAVVATSDHRCGALGVGSGSCAVTSAPTTFGFDVVAEPTGSSSLTFTVVADDPRADPDPGNDRAIVRLGS